MYANVSDCVALEVREFRTTAWSRANVNTRHISSNTFSRMERDFERIFTVRGVLHRWLHIHQRKGTSTWTALWVPLFILYSYFSSYRNTTTKPGRTRYRDMRPVVSQVGSQHWHGVRKLIRGLSVAALLPPAKAKDTRKDCELGHRSVHTVLRYIIPKVVAVGAVGAPSIADELPKVTKETLMARIAARQMWKAGEEASEDSRGRQVAHQAAWQCTVCHVRRQVGMKYCECPAGAGRRMMWRGANVLLKHSTLSYFILSSLFSVSLYFYVLSDMYVGLYCVLMQ